MRNARSARFLTSLVLTASLLLLLPGPLQAEPLNQDGSNQVAEPANASEQEFTTVIEDLPLMPGLTTVQDGDVLFAVPHEGRIAETEASGPVAIDDVYNFYRRSLPHLGWKVIDGRTYQREKERLLIDARSDGKITTVQFSIKPAS
ncbi:MAG: hypothetical protein M3N08_00710 [Pseudomonadota bacterium]|nr:hypothetical protein [Pseudomonadota bacterium]